MKKKVIVWTVLVTLILAVTGTAMGGITTTDSDGVRHLVVTEDQEYANYSQKEYANLTLPEIIRNNESLSYDANATSLTLKVGNSTMSDTYDLDTAGGEVWLNYTDGDYWANLTLNGGADYVNASFEASNIKTNIGDAVSIVTYMIPVAIMIMVIGVIMSALSGISKGGSW